MWVPRMSAKPLKSKSATTLSRQSTNSPPLTWARHRNLPKSHRESLGKQIPDGKNQNAHVPSMRSQQVVPWQWNLDHLHKTETSLEHFLSAMSQAGILRVKWQDHMTNSETLSRAETPSMYSILSQRRLRWLGHTHRMDASPRKTYTDNWRPKSNKSGALFCGSRTRANVTSKHAKFIQTTQKMPRVIVPAGDGQRMR